MATTAVPLSIEIGVGGSCWVALAMTSRVDIPCLWRQRLLWSRGLLAGCPINGLGQHHPVHRHRQSGAQEGGQITRILDVVQGQREPGPLGPWRLG